MMRSMYAAVAGLRTHQTRMDVIGDNIANVNTPGFKRARATFQDIFYQTLQGGSVANENRGGTNPQQIGLGIALSSIDVIHTQGAPAPTNNGTDLMIQGDGFFVLTDGTNYYYTRAGNFHFDNEGYLVNPQGLYVVNVDVNSNDRIQVSTTASSYSISSDGTVKYIESDGTVVDNQKIALAKFPNPGGLIKVGQNLYRYDPAAGDEPGGQPYGGNPGEDGRGTIIAGALEMSNVELAQEFTDMITTQRGFQANAKTITTSDEMLETLVNIVR